MWHRLDRILGRRGFGTRAGEARCEACGGPLGPDPALVLESELAGRRRRVCSPECYPALWKKMVVGRQKLSETEEETGRSGE
jgi:hypothetical protein